MSGRLSCMYSKVGSYQWNWIQWALCSDAPISKNNPAYWNVYLETEEGGMLTDYEGNILRVTRYGSNWGVAYAVKPSFLVKDTTHSPTSLFVVDKDLLDWIRYTTGNLGKTEQYCPAGYRSAYKRVKRTLPPNFQLSDDWIRRLYEIAVSTIDTARPSGVCGVCLLHSFQMLAELQEYHSQGPLQSGGYFFDTARGRDPFISFRQRYPLLNTLLTDVPYVYAPAGNTNRQLVFASARTMLPQYNWILSSEFTVRSRMLSHINSLIHSPPGSIWLAILKLRRPDRTSGWHAVPILRTSQGLVVIQTRASVLSFDIYRQCLTPTTDMFQVMDYLEIPDRTLTRLITIQLGEVYHNTFDFAISNRNCTGEGDDRRGTGGYPASTSVNQCSRRGGRCTLL
ncbi:PF07598 family protein [Leptospira borgpetersenii serovar Mini str. 201000851]|nr:PF07598 family protein [Leptospira borgpetersenii serovar Mini str. 201000851]